MQLDNEQQRVFLLEVIAQVSFPGQIIDQVYDIKKKIENAPITLTKKTPRKKPAPAPEAPAK